MRLGIVTAVYPPVRGGMSRVAQREAAALGALHDVTVFSLARRDENRERDASVRIVRLRVWPRISFGGFAPQLVRLLWRSDAVYAHLPAYGCMGALIVWRLLRRRPLVVTVHMDPIGTGWRRIAFALARPLLRATIRVADAVRVSSDGLKDSSLLCGVRNVQVIPFGVDAPTTRSIGDYDSREHAVLFVGGLSRTHYFKGVPVLLQAWAQVKQPAQLWIVGDGDLRRDYEAQSQSLGILDRVIFFGALSDEDLHKRYERARALVLPSTDQSETFGMVIVEAMAHGCPVVASRLSGVDRVVEHGVTGMLTPPSDVTALSSALQQVLDDEARAARMSEAARSRALTFGTWGDIARRISDLL